uniref:Uncharacterized protein n=1 Tax=Trepomonas sp. PC1 TaxID=1076344 RepID=A0A146KDX6_9EUKA|eukprot:JAP94114.1 Hypothetical protein TPC1_13351 [Trepomonas sp. PC1]
MRELSALMDREQKNYQSQNQKSLLEKGQNYEQIQQNGVYKKQLQIPKQINLNELKQKYSDKKEETSIGEIWPKYDKKTAQMLYEKGRGVGVWEESHIGTWENDESTSEGEIKIYRKFE